MNKNSKFTFRPTRIDPNGPCTVPTPEQCDIALHTSPLLDEQLVVVDSQLSKFEIGGVRAIGREHNLEVVHQYRADFLAKQINARSPLFTFRQWTNYYRRGLKWAALKYGAALIRSRGVALDRPVRDEDGKTLIDDIASSEDWNELPSERLEAIAQVRMAIGELTDNHRELIEEEMERGTAHHHYGEAERKALQRANDNLRSLLTSHRRGESLNGQAQLRFAASALLDDSERELLLRRVCEGIGLEILTLAEKGKTPEKTIRERLARAARTVEAAISPNRERALLLLPIDRRRILRDLFRETPTDRAAIATSLGCDLNVVQLQLRARLRELRLIWEALEKTSAKAMRSLEQKARTYLEGLEREAVLAHFVRRQLTPEVAATLGVDEERAREITLAGLLTIAKVDDLAKLAKGKTSRMRLREAIATLPEEAQRIAVTRHFLDKATLDDLARERGLKRSRIRQSLVEACRFLS